jgi:hypothetical protein
MKQERWLKTWRRNSTVQIPHSVGSTAESLSAKNGWFTKFKDITPWSRVLPEELTDPQVLKKFPEF